MKTKDRNVHQELRAVREKNQEELRRAHVCAIGLVGGPGCGKTTLLKSSIARLMPGVNVGLLVCELGSNRASEAPELSDARVVHLNVAEDGTPGPRELHEAMEKLDTAWLDLLFIEHVGSLAMRALPDLGQDLTATVFSVAGGDDKADKHPELVRDSDILILNKIDLLPAVPFHLDAFRDDVHRLNPRIELVELSALNGNGFETWINWLKARIQDPHGPNACTDQYFG